MRPNHANMRNDPIHHVCLIEPIIGAEDYLARRPCFLSAC